MFRGRSKTMQRSPYASATLCPLAVASHAGSAVDETADVESVTTTTESPTSTTVLETAFELPAPGEGWDLLFFGFDDVLTERTAELYAEAVAEMLGTEVRLSRPSGFDHVWAATMLAQLKGDRYPPLGDMVPPAEIIVLLSRPGESGDGSDAYVVEDFERCWRLAARGEPPTTDLPPDYWDIYRADLNEIYDELWNLRQGTPTVLITIDMYNPSLPQQRENKIDAECIAWFEAWSDVIAEAAGANGSLVVSLHDLFNGPNHDLDPAASGYIGEAEDAQDRRWYRTTPAGAAVIAQALSEAGVDPVTQP